MLEGVMKRFGYVREELLRAAEQSLTSTRRTLEKERTDATAYKKNAEAQIAAKERNISGLNEKLSEAAKEKKALLGRIASLEAKIPKIEDKAKKAIAAEKERSARARRELAAAAAKAQKELKKALRKAEARERALLRKLKAKAKVARKGKKKRR